MSEVGRASRPNLRRTASVPLALAVCIAVAACGGGGGHKNNAAANAPKLTPTALVSKAFDASDAIDSGNISLTATVNLDGLKQLDGKPIVLALSGPFQRTAGKTSADLAATVSIGSSSAHLGIDVLPGHDYLGIDGTFYDLPTGAGSTLRLAEPAEPKWRRGSRDRRDRACSARLGSTRTAG